MPFEYGRIKSSRGPAAVWAVIIVSALIIFLVVAGLIWRSRKEAAMRRNRISVEMVRSPGGSLSPACGGKNLRMADENRCGQQSGKVDIAAFSIDKTEVTNEQYNQCVSAGKCAEAFDGGCQTRDTLGRPWPVAAASLPDTFRTARHPVVCVSWRMAADFCRWASKRLPSENEWELAAGGGNTDNIFPWGNIPGTGKPNFLAGLRKLSDSANHGNPVEGGPDDSDGWRLTAPAGSFENGASPVGALDMAGNVWEWTDGCYENRTGGDACVKRPIRGGSWRSPVEELRVSNRNGAPPETRADDIGFRCAK